MVHAGTQLNHFEKTVQDVCLHVGKDLKEGRLSPASSKATDTQALSQPLLGKCHPGSDVF